MKNPNGGRPLTEYVAESTSSSRAEDVSFKHHEIVAPLPPEQQKEFLQKAFSKFYEHFPNESNYYKKMFEDLENKNI